MNARRVGAVAVLLLASRVAAASCDCQPDSELRTAATVVVAQVVALELPSLNEDQPDSPVRDDQVVARLVIREALRGQARGALRLVAPSNSMCPTAAPPLGIWLVLALPDEPLAPDEAIGIGFCSQLLSLGRHWNGWDEGTLRLRDALRDPGHPQLRSLIEEYRLQPPPLPIPPRPRPSGSR